MSAVELILAALAAANLLGVGGLYYRMGAAIATIESASKRVDRLHDDMTRLTGRVTELERHQRVRLIKES
ncbi:hypothetical protein [Cognatiyoonia sp. IB215182]|uniref:hypothetical protein n=1 Tax=Cognatiyoonia sp. IB215182 TaxID=3097353 RepID=UPI002A169DDA|nr:hypothetical protein [Cognatiyoonia sp. IB215182]MDX8353660.1 hypothetical protein [Cognatiyoonia sp. IB215182]